MLLQIYLPQIKKYFYILKSFKLYKFHGGVSPIQTEPGVWLYIPHHILLYTTFYYIQYHHIAIPKNVYIFAELDYLIFQIN